jgi:hypothetical protein
MRPEAVVVAEILEKHGARPEFHLRRNNSGALPDRNGRLVRFGLPGSGDIEGFLSPRGRFLTVECKRLSKDLGELQRNYQAMVRARGGVCITGLTEPQFAHEIQAAIERENEITRRLAEALA